MKTAEDLALRFAALVAQEREAEEQLAKVRTEKGEALRRLLAFKPNGNGASASEGSAAKERVFDLLESNPRKAFSTSEVAETLRIAGNVASAYLSELYKKDKRIARIGMKGWYQSLTTRPKSQPDESLTTE
jgi:hypothetical protein